MRLKLDNGGQYIKDIKKIVNAIRINGTAQNLIDIDISYPGASQLTLKMCAQFDSLTTQNGSLYILGFVNSNGAYSFNIPALLALWGVPYTLLPGVDGSYGSLDCPGPGALPAIQYASIINYIESVAKHNGGEYANNFKKNLARLIIMSSEALRFNEIAQGVQRMIQTRGGYQPNTVLIHNWGGRTLNSM